MRLRGPPRGTRSRHRALSSGGGSLRERGGYRVHVRAGVPSGDAVCRSDPARDRNSHGLQYPGTIDEPRRGKTPADRRRSPGNCAETGFGVSPAGKRTRGARSRRGGARRTRAVGSVDGDGIRCQGGRCAVVPYIARGFRPRHGTAGSARRWRRGRKHSDYVSRPLRRIRTPARCDADERGRRHVRRGSRCIDRGRGGRGQDGDRFRSGDGAARATRRIVSEARRRRSSGQEFQRVTHIQTGTILDEILARTTADLPERKISVPVSDLEVAARSRSAPLSLRAALGGTEMSVIAEIKRASPSRGTFPIVVEPANVARDYIAGGAAAISVLTNEPYFRGSLGDLDAVAEVAHARPKPVPVLRKDFVVDPYQIVEARAHGADAVLLIVAA